ncbi:MAG: aldo/keto reductase [Thaumarchaeota archaeon]|nr:aldo/keto reductase [Nitrososphaerota archaeon]
MLIPGRITAEGSAKYAQWAQTEKKAIPEHFRIFDSLSLSSLGFGTYLGESDAETDRLVEEAAYQSMASGAVNVIDTAINYRMQRAERSVGRAIARIVGEGTVKRDSLLVCTKNGYLTSDADVTADFWSYIQRELIKPGKLKIDEIAGEVHSMALPFLRDQLERSLANLGLESVDVMYLHNAAESWLPEIGYRRFLERLADVFSYYEKERARGRLGYYGLATWTCFRVPKGEREHVNLDDVVEVAKNAAIGGKEHGFRFIQVPFNPGMNEALELRNQRIADDPLTTFGAAKRLDVGVFTSAPFGEGRLLGHKRVPQLEGSIALSLLQFSRSASPGIIATLVGQKDEAHVRENLRIAQIQPLEEPEFADTYGPLLEKS